MQVLWVPNSELKHNRFLTDSDSSQKFLNHLNWFHCREYRIRTKYLIVSCRGQHKGFGLYDNICRLDWRWFWRKNFVHDRLSMMIHISEDSGFQTVIPHADYSCCRHIHVDQYWLRLSGDLHHGGRATIFIPASLVLLLHYCFLGLDPWLKELGHIASSYDHRYCRCNFSAIVVYPHFSDRVTH